MDLKQIENDLKYLHKDQVDNSGVSYDQHPIAVKNSLPAWASDDLKAAALLHDVIEDTEYTAEYLKEKYNLSDNVIFILNVITKKEKVEYDEYINRLILLNDLEIIALKLSDMSHNMNPNRLAKLSEKRRNYYIWKYSNNLPKLHIAYDKLVYNIHILYETIKNLIELNKNKNPVKYQEYNDNFLNYKFSHIKDNNDLTIAKYVYLKNLHDEDIDTYMYMSQFVGGLYE